MDEYKEALRKARWANKKETGKRYLGKTEMHTMIKAMKEFKMPKENKNCKVHQPTLLGDLLKKYA